MSKRNLDVEVAVDDAIKWVDHFVSEQALSRVPPERTRSAVDAQLSHKSSSVRLASLFFLFYSLNDRSWDFDTLPSGLRGQWGDKKLANELTKRNISLHNAVTAFGENLGWKGNVNAVRLSNDDRFQDFAKTMRSLSNSERTYAAEYAASRFAETRMLVAPLPPVGPEVLTYVKARLLLTQLIGIPSGGNIQQFVIASLLYVHRKRFGHKIRTHHAHASDKYDSTYGDIEEFRDDQLVSAYEVTVRPDWKNRISDFRDKMDRSGLKKYTIIASNVGDDADLADPADMLDFIQPYGRDLAIVDIEDVINVFASELTAHELRNAINQAHSYLSNPKLCGRPDVIQSFATSVSHWLDSAEV